MPNYQLVVMSVNKYPANDGTAKLTKILDRFNCAAHTWPILDDDDGSMYYAYSWVNGGKKQGSYYSCFLFLLLLFFPSSRISCFSRLEYHASPATCRPVLAPACPSMMLRNFEPFVSSLLFCVVFPSALVSGRLKLIRVESSLLPAET